MNLILNGPLATATVAVPVFTGNPPSGGSPGPGVPVWPTPVPPGALVRIFAFIAILKKKTFYNDQVGQDLGVIGAAASFDPAAVPPVKAEVKSGEVVLRFKKRAATESKSHQGVWVEGQVGAATAWGFLAIDTTDPYNDTRPLAVAGVPEKRRYRLCFWDGEPTNVWTDVVEVLYGG